MCKILVGPFNWIKYFLLYIYLYNTSKLSEEFSLFV